MYTNPTGHWVHIDKYTHFKHFLSSTVEIQVVVKDHTLHRKGL
jgi:hypothetical protein